MKKKWKQALVATFTAALLSIVPYAHAAPYSCDPCYDPCNINCSD